MPRENKWYRAPAVWLEAFVIVNLGFLTLDIYLAHSINQFRHEAEYIPYWFSMIAPPVLLLGLLLGEGWGLTAVWRDVGHLVGWCAIIIGLVGVVLHLDSRFFYERSIKSLVYAAPFAAPLAYTGLGMLLLVNRMVDRRSEEWPRWVLLLGLGGVVGNFVFSLTDHAQNGFFHKTEWIPVASSALAVGFLVTIYITPVTRRFLALCGIVLLIQAAVGLLGFFLHNRANLHGPSPKALDNFVFGAPALAPMLFPNLALLCGIGLWVLRDHLPRSEVSEPASAA
ncbi:MAG TPA: hypothetical protein VN641_10545 [Urbifossiella sp.]|jgi:uncharacterized membrane protein YhdT|nr:hypothetical protein [Urbifossiella sp.]